MTFFTQLKKKNNQKSIWKHKSVQNSQSNLKQKDQWQEYYNANFKLYFIAIVMKLCGPGTKTDKQMNGTDCNAQK